MKSMELRKLYQSLVPYEVRFRFYKLRHSGEIRKLRSHVYTSDKGDFSLKAFDQHKCLFIHITKTAGTSVATSLFNYLPYHYTAIEYRVIYGKRDFNNYYKFAFVRNPWDRLYSAYRYLKIGGWNDTDRRWASQNIGDFDDFNQFVKQWITKENIQKHLHFKPQYEFICDNNKRLLLNYLAYFETLESDFNHICRKLNIDAKLAHHNINPGSSYIDAYDDISRNIVNEVYADDIELFGYKFDGIADRKIVNTR